MKKQQPKKNPRPVQVSGISVHCHFDELKPAEDLKPFPGNWKKDPPAQLDRYEHVVEGNGWRRAIVVSKLSWCITKGHGAWQMAKRRGWDVPVEYQAYATRAEEIRDLVADNKLAELAQDDDDALRKLLDELDPAGRDLAVVSEEEFAQLVDKLSEDQPLTELEIPTPPKMAWVLISIPLVRFAEINAHVEAIASVAGTMVETSASDQGADAAEEKADDEEN